VPQRLDAFAYVHGEYWSLGEKIGTYGFSSRKHKGEAGS